MQRSSLPRAGLFILECARFSFLTGILVSILSPASDAESGRMALFPWMVYGVPNALFLLMALFLWVNPLRYKAYNGLYISGKVLSIFAVLGWFFATRRFSSFFENMGGLSRNIFFTLVLLCIDIFSILAAVYFLVKDKKNANNSLEQEDN